MHNKVTVSIITDTFIVEVAENFFGICWVLDDYPTYSSELFAWIGVADGEILVSFYVFE